MKQESREPLEQEIRQVAADAREAARSLRTVSSSTKDDALREVAAQIRAHKGDLEEANAKDIALAEDSNLSAAMIDRLRLTDSRIVAMAEGLEVIASLPDPVGEATGMWTRPNGLQICQVRVAIGVIGFIYESRPNVTADAAGLCLKSGNAVILRGGSEAIHSNTAIADLLESALRKIGLPPASIQLIKRTDREAVTILLGLDKFVDLIIPRGGEGLIRSVAENSSIPVILHYKGVCHTYVDSSADLKMAEDISFNAKVSRPSVCNAMETLLVNEDVAEDFLPPMIRRLEKAGVETRGCSRAQALVSSIKPASDEDWDTEYLDLILSVRVVGSLEEAIEHIDRHGTSHSEAIVTQNYNHARTFLEEVDAATVYVNASTRFTDGFEFGFGAEIGISTSRLHCRGPMGLKELTTTKYIIYGDGQVRE